MNFTLDKLLAKGFAPRIDFEWIEKIGSSDQSSSVGVVLEGMLRLDEFDTSTYAFIIEFNDDAFVEVYIDDLSTPVLDRLECGKGKKCCPRFSFDRSSNPDVSRVRVRVEYLWRGTPSGSSPATLKMRWQPGFSGGVYEDNVCNSRDPWETVPDGQWNRLDCPAHSIDLPYLAYKGATFCRCLPLYFNDIRSQAFQFSMDYKVEILGLEMPASQMEDFRIESSPEYVPLNGMCTKGVALWQGAHTVTFLAHGLLGSRQKTRVVLNLQYYDEYTSSPEWAPFSRYSGKQYYHYTNAADETITLTGLYPGTRYRATLSWQREVSNVWELVDSTPEQYFQTKCTCGRETGNDNFFEISHGIYNRVDPTGTPNNFYTTQENGYIRFSLFDYSYCSEYLQFSRMECPDGQSIIECESNQRGDDVVEFMTVFQPGNASDDNATANAMTYHVSRYYTSSPNKCGGESIKTPEQASDDLRQSNLEVGKIYSYLARAGASKYMAPHLTVSLGAAHATEVHWEASIKLRITTAPQNGGVGVENVFVTWALPKSQYANRTNAVLDPAVLGHGHTDKDGYLNIPFLVSKQDAFFLSNNVKVPIELFYYKEQAIQIQDGNRTRSMLGDRFTCNGGATNCTAGTVAYLQHLDFDKPITIYDMSEIPILGTVTIRGTDCPLQNVLVCPVRLSSRGDKSPSTKSCAATDEFGKYVVTAHINTEVYLELKARDEDDMAVTAGHFFEPGPFSAAIVDATNGIRAMRPIKIENRPYGMCQSVRSSVS